MAITKINTFHCTQICVKNSDKVIETGNWGEDKLKPKYRYLASINLDSHQCLNVNVEKNTKIFFFYISNKIVSARFINL